MIQQLYGRNSKEGIVGLRILYDTAYECLMRLYVRDGRKVTSIDVPHKPFFLLSTLDALSGFSSTAYRAFELKGDNHYKYATIFQSNQVHWDAARRVAYNAGTKDPDEIYLIKSPEQQFLTMTGMTMYKGMSFSDILRMQVDIETFSSEGGFPDARRPGDEIIIVSATTNWGDRWLLHTAQGVEVEHGIICRNEEDLLRRLIQLVKDVDPDVIEGHNCLSFDWPYIAERCERYNIPLEIGRDDSVPRRFASSQRFAERTVQFDAFDIQGRNIIDTYLQVMAFDVFKRDLPGYGLKVCAKYFGFAAENREYVEGDQISKVWLEDPARLLKYALDDAIETEHLARHLSGSTFYLTQMLPMPYERVARSGPAAKIEALMVREYLRNGQSIPIYEHGQQEHGAYTDIFMTGVIGPVVYADVESLYPSIMLNFRCEPGEKKDPMNLFHFLLQKLTDLRFEYKDAMRAAKKKSEEAETPEEKKRFEEEAGEYDARQSSVKILINAFYGAMGYGRFLWNNFREADRVATTGQDILRTIIDEIHKDGGQVIECDTDGVLFVPPPGIKTGPGETEDEEYVKSLTARMPQGIKIGFDGRAKVILSYKKKNYALVGYDGKIKVKGSSFKARSVEYFGRQFMKHAIEYIANKDIEGLHQLYLNTRDMIIERKWTPEDFARTETLKKSLREYQQGIKEGGNRAAAYELAIAEAERRNTSIKSGDRVSYYITGTSKSPTIFESSKLVDEWTPDAPDENTAFYLSVLDGLCEKFRVFFRPLDYHLIFGEPDLFGFDPSKVVPLISKVERDEHLDEVPL